MNPSSKILLTARLVFLSVQLAQTVKIIVPLVNPTEHINHIYFKMFVILHALDQDMAAILIKNAMPAMRSV
jgi:hypothetical protein